VLVKALRSQPRTDQDRPHGCIDGVGYLGELVKDPETGEEIDDVERVPCRKCL
jgi:hypothetical protein